MESFYDREVGVAWGPITKEEMLDDLLVFNNKAIKHRNTLNCNPTFNDDKDERLIQITSKHVEVTNDEVVVLSSEDEIDLKQLQKDTLSTNSPTAKSADSLLDKTTNHHQRKHDMQYHLSGNSNDSLGDSLNNSLLNYSSNDIYPLDVFNRLPTPANIEEYTCESILDIEEDKHVSKFFNTSNIENVSSSQKPTNKDLIDAEQNEIVTLKEGAIKCNLEDLLTKIDIEKNSSYELPESFSSHSYPIADYLSKNKSDPLEHDISLQEIEIEDHLYSYDSGKVHEEVSHGTEDSVHENFLFNDTLAEMERLLNEGLNCSSSSENSTVAKTDPLVIADKPTVRLSKSFEEVPRTPEFNVPTVKIHPSSEVKPINLKFVGSNYKGDSTKSVTKKLHKHQGTKIPVPPAPNLRTFTKPVLTPTNNIHPATTTAPSSAKKRFKNIESPISVYIKNSGVAPLYQKITPSKPLASGKSKIEKTIKVNKENSIIFPKVTYKPARIAIVTKGKDIRLPQKIESLLQQKSNVIKHEGRIGAINMEKCGSVTNKKYSHKADLTLDSNTSLNTVEDVSIRCTKREFIK